MISKTTIKKIRQAETRSTRIGRTMLWVLVSLVSGLVMGCTTQLEDSGIRALVGNDQETSVSPLAGYSVAGFVVLPPEEAGDRSASKSRYAPHWLPTTSQTAEAVNLLPEYLIQASGDPQPYSEYSQILPGVLERLPKTICQASGVTLDGNRRGIQLNFCVDKSFGESRRWNFGESEGGRLNHWTWSDWSVVYLTEEKRFCGLWINLGY